MDADRQQRRDDSIPRRLTDQAFADVSARFPVRDLTRVRDFLEIVSGQSRPVFHAYQSTKLPPVHFPGLPAEPFYETSAFAEARDLEQEFELIRDEAGCLLTGAVTPKPYESKGITRWPKWKKLTFYEQGRSGRVPETFEQFPATGQLVDRLVPEYEDFLSIGFLIQDGNMRLAPHIDWFNLYVSLWLPIIVPAGCGIEVAGERRELKAGKCIAFDNSFMHSSWNDSDEPRIVFAIYRLTPRITRIEAKAFMYIRETYGKQFGLAAPTASARLQ
jgi:aspartyl/asparaginyl beta-hydroxylase (cupin superfamily)